MCAFVILFVALPVMASSGPGDREVTNPKSVESTSNPQARPIPISELFFTRRVGSSSWSPDGREIVFTMNLTGVNNLWKVSASGGWPIQLSQSDDRQYGTLWSPDGGSILYGSDRAGSEYSDLFVIPSNGGEAVNLMSTPEVSENGLQFSPDGTMLAIYYKLKTSPVTDIALLDWRTHTVRNLTKEQARDYTWDFVTWSPDGKHIYGNRCFVDYTDSSIYRVDVATGERENLSPHDGRVLIYARSISADGRTLLIVSTEKGGFRNVALMDIASKKLTWVTDTQWDAHPGWFAPRGGKFTYMIGEDGRTDIYLADRDSGQQEKVSFPPGLNMTAGNPTPFSPSGDQLLVTHQSSKRPPDLWIYDIRTRQARQLTFSVIASLNTASLPQSQLVHYKSFDGKVISAFIWIPFNLKRDGSNPGIVLTHGGPADQWMDYFNTDAASLASRGYVCIAPNVRGSTGYGMEFQKANYRDLGGGDLKDVVYAARFLIDTGYVNIEKIGITGSSYGGYLTLMAVGKTPDLWAAAVDRFGIVNWFNMLESEDPQEQELQKALLGDPVKDRKVYEDASPINYLRNARAPLLVLQGENDIRVPKAEAEQVVDILKGAGKSVEVHYYPKEGHGFGRRENRIDAQQRLVAWFDRYLKGSGSVP